jgi:hypothetical protein
MINNKRAMSAVVTTVLLVALAIGAVVILWTVLSGTITEQTDNMGESIDCLDAPVSVRDYDCAADKTCNVTVSRGSAGEGEIDSVRIQAISDTDSVILDRDAGNMAPGTIKTYDGLNFEITEEINNIKAGAVIGETNCQLA